MADSYRSPIYSFFFLSPTVTSPSLSECDKHIIIIIIITLAMMQTTHVDIIAVASVRKCVAMMKYVPNRRQSYGRMNSSFRFHSDNLRMIHREES